MVVVPVYDHAPSNSSADRVALITGVTGQDGSYLAELLIEKGYQVHGIIRRSSSFNTARIEHLYHDSHDQSRLTLHYGDLTDGSSLRRVIDQIRPDEVYNLGAQSHVRISFDHPEYTADVAATGTLRLLEAVRDHQESLGRTIKVYQASSSEMFGSAPPPQNESTRFHPRSPYAVSKVAGYWYSVNYREAYGMFVSNGILFNHESPRRGETFVTRKITRALGRIVVGTQEKLFLGNLTAQRDWGHAQDYVLAMWSMLQHSKPDDFVVATGESHSIEEFLDIAAARLRIDWRRHVEIDPRYYRPAEVDHLRGEATKIRTELGWAPQRTFTDLVHEMVDHDVTLAAQEAQGIRVARAA